MHLLGDLLGHRKQPHVIVSRIHCEHLVLSFANAGGQLGGGQLPPAPSLVPPMQTLHQHQWYVLIKLKNTFHYVS